MTPERERHHRFDVVQSGLGDEPERSFDANAEGNDGLGDREDADARALEDEDARTRAMRRDPRWAEAAAMVYDADVGAKQREVRRALEELRTSQDSLAKTIEDAEARARWVDAIEGAVETLDKLPEYTLKAKTAVKRMAELRERMEKAEARVRLFGN